MIDIHTHILPEVDDGSRSFEESIEMIKKEISDGITDIVLTPHMYAREQKKDRRFHKAQFEKLLELTKDLPIHLYLAAEIYYRSHIDLKLDEFVFPGTNIVLMEFSMEHETPIEEIVYNYQVSGYQIIVAHVERYKYLSFDDLIKIKKTGALLQVNASSILGLDKYSDKKAIKFMVKNKLIDVVATDTHGIKRRPPILKEAYDKLRKYYKDDDTLNVIFNKIKLQK